MTSPVKDYYKALKTDFSSFQQAMIDGFQEIGLNPYIENLFQKKPLTEQSSTTTVFIEAIVQVTQHWQYALTEAQQLMSLEATLEIKINYLHLLPESESELRKLTAHYQALKNEIAPVAEHFYQASKKNLDDCQAKILTQAKAYAALPTFVHSVPLSGLALTIAQGVTPNLFQRAGRQLMLSAKDKIYDQQILALPTQLGSLVKETQYDRESTYQTHLKQTDSLHKRYKALKDYQQRIFERKELTQPKAEASPTLNHKRRLH